MAQKYYFFQNRITKAQNVRLNPNDLGLLRSYGVFDFLRTFNAKPFLLNEHLRRFKNSAKLLKIPCPYTQRELASVIKKLIKKNNFPESTVRLVLSGGVGKDSMSPAQKPTFLILIERLHSFPKKYYAKGIKLITLEHLREYPEAKTLNYAFALKHQKDLYQTEAQEMLYIYRGQVLECSTSNFFMFKGKTLITPKEEILLGTTRNKIIELSRKHFRIQERKISFPEIAQADEVFISATLKEVLPVVKINAFKIGNGKPGPKTQKVADLFKAYIKQVCF